MQFIHVDKSIIMYGGSKIPNMGNIYSLLNDTIHNSFDKSSMIIYKLMSKSNTEGGHISDVLKQLGRGNLKSHRGRKCTGRTTHN